MTDSVGRGSGASPGLMGVIVGKEVGQDGGISRVARKMMAEKNIHKAGRRGKST